MATSIQSRILEDSPLYAALNERKFSDARECLNNEDINTQYEKGKTLLHWAAENNRIQVTEFLLENRANTETRDDLGRTPLHVSVGSVNVVVSYLLSKRANVNAQTPEKKLTALHLAVLRKSEELMGILLDAGAEILPSSAGMTPLHYAVSAEMTPLTSAANLAEKINIVGRLLVAGADVNAQTKKDKLTALHEAVESDAIEITKLLIRWKANPYLKNSKNNSPVELAHQENKTELLTILMGSDLE
ncbi:MAG: hypothetical protein KR126chlam1_01279 [Chlamydiae bacterium]|nr:hypothetical protein [Chlamydiota bacterium]